MVVIGSVTVSTSVSVVPGAVDVTWNCLSAFQRTLQGLAELGSKIDLASSVSIAPSQLTVLVVPGAVEVILNQEISTKQCSSCADFAERALESQGLRSKISRAAKRMRAYHFSGSRSRSRRSDLESLSASLENPVNLLHELGKRLAACRSKSSKAEPLHASESQHTVSVAPGAVSICVIVDGAAVKLQKNGISLHHPTPKGSLREGRRDLTS